MNFSYRHNQGFTLLEVIVTVALVAILTGVVVSGFGPAREQSRDTQRQTDLRTVEAALALYKNKYGQYPEACNGATTGATINLSGQSDASFACTSGSAQYIVGLAPEFIPKLPVDPKLNGADSGFVYAVNTEGSVYKFMALDTVETRTVTYGDPFFRCGQEFDVNQLNNDTSAGASFLDPEICERVPPSLPGNYNPSGYAAPAACMNADNFERTFAISAGFSDDTRGLSGSRANKGREYDTEIVRCG